MKLTASTKMKKLTINLLVLAAFIAILPISASASYSISLNSFVSYDGLTGAISSTVNNSSLTLYCVQNDVTVNVPGTYYAQNVGLQSTSSLQAAWLLATYGSTHTDTNDSIALQLAIWQALGHNTTPADFYQNAEVAEANALVNSISTNAPKDLSYLRSSYSVIDLYSDPALTQPVQNQLGLVNTTPTPIPAGIYLLGTGLMGLFGLSRREKK